MQRTLWISRAIGFNSSVSFWWTKYGFSRSDQNREAACSYNLQEALHPTFARQGYSSEDLFAASSSLSINQKSSNQFSLYFTRAYRDSIYKNREQEKYRSTSMFTPLVCCWEGTNSTMWSVTHNSQSISFFHLAFLSGDMGSSRFCSPKTEAAFESFFMIRLLISSTYGADFIKIVKISTIDRQCAEVYIPARLVMAFDSAKAEETPFPPPDMSSPRSSFPNLSFISSKSGIKTETKKSVDHSWEFKLHTDEHRDDCHYYQRNNGSKDRSSKRSCYKRSP